MTRKERLHQRNEKVRGLFQELSAKNPKWRIDAVISEVAERMFLASRTVEAIISYEGVYNDAPQNPKGIQLRIFE
ncbi:hypothetical protein [Capnocytophaga canimorsus]|uniref:hypothetical protein n=1 Tax=Capnocytophaga canimorsus TaxID=28188 RepID=UPI0037CE6950